MAAARRTYIGFMTTKPLPPSATPEPAPAEAIAPKPKAPATAQVPEIGGPKGPEPTRYGDWEINGRCVDF